EVAQQFSLRDEARYMSNHRSSAFDSSKRLRHMPVAFVSAGCLEGTVNKKEEEKGSQPEPVAPSSRSPPPSRSPVATEAFAQMTIRSPSPAPSASSASSASSEELIVFRGRGHTPLTHATPPSHPIKADTTPSVAPLTTESQPASAATKAAPPTDNSQLIPNMSTGHAPSHAESDVDSDTNSVVDSLFQKRRGGKARWASKETPWASRSKPGIGWLPVKDRPNMDDFVNGEVNPRDAAMDDYMQNAEENGLTDEVLAASGFASRRELDLDAGDHNDWESDQEPEIPPKLEQDDGWTSDQARDLDGLSTSDDVEGIVARVTGQRTRASGLQYQVVYEGCTRDDARWIPATYLTTPIDKNLIEAYEAKKRAREQQQQQEDSSTSDSDSEFDIDGESSEEEVEVDDEQLARAWQKQEDMGIDDDDLVLFAGDAHFSSSYSASNAPRAAFDRPNNKRQQRAGGGKRADRAFPSASAAADIFEMDPYAGFDIMDMERPSLRPKKKGRKGQMPPELAGDDSDLNEQMQATWATDRAKKRLKKAEREELRRQGLLGRKGKGPDLSVKYKDGFIMDDVIEEIRDFWATDDAPTLSLPAMEAPRRAVIHQFVSEFGISSKSQGDGAKRHTILSKTIRTLAFDDDLFDSIMALKKYNRRLYRTGNLPLHPKKEKVPKGSKNRPTVSYKDGEVVGAKAPELGVENKGRAMLEKMGWSKGMALGAVDNKGILQPITHTVKITKAGLR
ncbi:hypothetical protein BU23DRAFT_454211, partial [Bimuria novae-zelandiae CBS 107.79]